MLVIFSVVIKSEKIRMAGRSGGRERGGKGKRKEKKEKEYSVLPLNAHIQRGATISMIPCLWKLQT